MRIEWLDSLKGFAIFLVVVGHVVLGYIKADIFPQFYNELQYIYAIIYSFHMPLFFLISGYLYKFTWSKNNTGVLKKIGNKFFNMVPLYLVFSLVFWLFKYYATLYSNIQMSEHFNFIDLIHIYIAPLAYLWFLYVLICLFIIIPLLESFIKPVLVFLVLFLLYIFAPHIEGMFAIVNLIIYGGVYFSLGSILFFYSDYLRNNIGNKLIIVSFISIAIACFSFPFTNAYNIFKFICGISVSVFLSIIFFRLQNYKFVSLWNSCGYYSLGIYILHLYFTGPLRTIFKYLSIDNIIIALILSSIISTLAPIFIVKFFARYKVTSWIFGETKLIKLE